MQRQRNLAEHAVQDEALTSGNLSHSKHEVAQFQGDFVNKGNNFLEVLRLKQELRALIVQGATWESMNAVLTDQYVIDSIIQCQNGRFSERRYCREQTQQTMAVKYSAVIMVSGLSGLDDERGFQ
jgi:hypothetical protein